MSDYIREIPSDSEVLKIEYEDELLRITIKLGIYENDEDKILLIFKGFCASNISPSWTSTIEGIQILGKSKFLQTTKKQLLQDEEPEENIKNLKSYQFLSSSTDDVSMEVVAESYKIEKV